MLGNCIAHSSHFLACQAIISFSCEPWCWGETCKYLSPTFFSAPPLSFSATDLLMCHTWYLSNEHSCLETMRTFWINANQFTTAEVYLAGVVKLCSKPWGCVSVLVKYLPVRSQNQQANPDPGIVLLPPISTIGPMGTALRLPGDWFAYVSTN